MSKPYTSDKSEIYREMKKVNPRQKWPPKQKAIDRFLARRTASTEAGPSTRPPKQPAQPKRKTERQILYDRAKELGFAKRLFSRSKNIDFKNFIEETLREQERNKIRADTIARYRQFLLDDNITEFRLSKNDLDLLPTLTNENQNTRKKYLHYIDLVDSTAKITKTLPINFNTESMLYSPTFYNEEIEGLEDSFKDAVRKVMTLTDLDYIIIRKNMPLNDTNKVNTGGFFPYEINDTLFIDNPDKSFISTLYETFYRYVSPNQNNDCFGYALSLAYPSLINTYKALRLFSNGNTISLKELPIIADKLDLCITEHHFVGPSQDKKRKGKIYGNPDSPPLNIIFYKGHCFLDETTTLQLSDLLKLFGYKYHGERRKPLSSLELLRFLMNENSREAPANYKCFLRDLSSATALKLVNTTDLVIHGSDPSILNGSNDVPNYKGTCVNPKTGEKGYTGPDGIYPYQKYKTYNILPDDYDLVFFDYETYTQNGQHVPYMCGAIYNNTEKMFIGNNAPQQFFNYLHNTFHSSKKKLICIAHNLGYDLSFHIGIEGAEIIRRIGKSCSKSKAGQIKYKDLLINFMDSYSFLSFKLADFNKELGLGLDYKKGIFPYDMMNKFRLTANSCTIDKALKVIPSQDHPEFLESIQKYLIINVSHEQRHLQPKKFKIVSYAAEYCLLDCRILQQGFLKFREQIHKLTQLDTLDYISAPGLALAYPISLGRLDNVPCMTGVARHFIQQTIVGGRNQTANNTKHKPNCKIMDLDVVSLYPTAYKFLQIPQGPPEAILSSPTIYTTTSDLDSKYRWYFLEVEILEVLKPYSIASLSTVNPKTGVREWVDKPGTYFLNHVQLQDLIRFQKVIFRVLGGLGFPLSLPYVEWNDFVDTLFNERLRVKKENPCLAGVIKCILNSIYGRTLMSPITDKEKIFINLDDPKIKRKYETYLTNNFDRITLITPFEGYNGVKCATIQAKKSIYSHSSYNHIASTILALSKRIMNNYIYLCLDNNIPVYYTDTDSCFVPENDVPTFVKLHTSIYGYSPLGDKLGQLQNDYAKACPQGSTNIIATRSLFIAKKLYCIELEYTLNGETKCEYVTKIKGIPEKCVDYTYQKLGYATPFQMMEDIYNGKVIEFDLTLDNSVPRFSVGRDFKFKTLDDFKREVSAIDDPEIKKNMQREKLKRKRNSQ